jgi:hypothetical protein
MPKFTELLPLRPDDSPLASDGPIIDRTPPEESAEDFIGRLASIKYQEAWYRYMGKALPPKLWTRCAVCDQQLQYHLTNDAEDRFVCPSAIYSEATVRGA